MQIWHIYYLIGGQLLTKLLMAEGPREQPGASLCASIPGIKMNSVLVTDCDKHCDQKQLGEGRVYFIF